MLKHICTILAFINLKRIFEKLPNFFWLISKLYLTNLVILSELNFIRDLSISSIENGLNFLIYRKGDLLGYGYLTCNMYSSLHQKVIIVAKLWITALQKLLTDAGSKSTQTIVTNHHTSSASNSWPSPAGGPVVLGSPIWNRCSPISRFAPRLLHTSNTVF